MKKSISVFLALLMMAALVGCGSGSGDEGGGENVDGEWQWDRDIEMVCMYDVGSGTDSTLRAICDQVGAELGVNVNINNVSGGSGLTGMEYFYTQPADGYTFGMLGVSHVLAGLKGTASFDVKNEMSAVCCLVQDNEMIVSNVDLPFSDWDGLLEYAKAHPGELTLGLTSINGVDAMSVQQLFNDAGIDITLVAVDSELYSMVIGGHVDLAVGSPNECKDYIEAGQLNALFIVNTERSSVLPDVPCSGDYGYEAEIGPWRAIFARTGTPEAAIESLDAAFQKVMNEDSTWAEYKELNGLNDRPAQRDHEEMQAYWLDQFEIMGELLAK